MIVSYSVTSGFARDLKGFPVTGILSPGLTILFGPNGSGKSSLIRILAAHTGCGVATSGWSHLLDPLEIKELLGNDILGLPAAYAHSSPGNCKAQLEWDGEPVYVSQMETLNERLRSGQASTRDIATAYDTPSSGQWSRRLLNELTAILNRGAPDITTDPDDDANDVWVSCWKTQRDYILGLRDSHTGPGRTPVMTILLDEPERSLDIPTQAFFWSSYVTALCKVAQVVVATHSPFALRAKDASFIQFGGVDYLKKCRAVINDCDWGLTK